MNTIPTSCTCSCNVSAAPKVIYACSGSADVGELSDRVARKLAKAGHGKMSCLAGIGGRVSGLLNTAESATTILAIDGCKLHCALNTMKEAGFSDIKHLCLEDLGYTKGATEVSDVAIEKAVQHAGAMLNEER